MSRQVKKMGSSGMYGSINGLPGGIKVSELEWISFEEKKAKIFICQVREGERRSNPHS